MRNILWLGTFALVACGQPPIQRVPSQTEVIYSKDNPCQRGEINEIRDEMDPGSSEEIPQEVRVEPEELSFAPAYKPAESWGVGKGNALYAPHVLGGYGQLGGQVDQDQERLHERQEKL